MMPTIDVWTLILLDVIQKFFAARRDTLIAREELPGSVVLLVLLAIAGAWAIVVPLMIRHAGWFARFSRFSDSGFCFRRMRVAQEIRRFLCCAFHFADAIVATVVVAVALQCIATSCWSAVPNRSAHSVCCPVQDCARRSQGHAWR